MLYPKNRQASLSKELFESPTSEYRGAPFWAWNCVLKTETLLEQIEMMKQMGMGGFHMHVRTGMATSYLTDEFMAHVRTCVEKARDEKMLAWLYDEDRWPSGAAGGIVTSDPAFVAQNLLITPTPYGALPGHIGSTLSGSDGHGGRREENGELLCVYDIELNEDGTLFSYRRIAEDDSPRGVKWYVYVESAAPSAWINNHPYVDTLNKKAIERFIEVTHERYNEKFGEDFGSIIPAIFTDEPQFSGKGTLGFPMEKKDVFMTWTPALPDVYRETYGEELLDKLPELIWELPDGQISVARYRFHDCVTEMFATNFCDTIGNWCTEHGLMLGGHVMDEPTLTSQTRVIGDAMRCYRAWKNMPGIDMLCDWHEYNTAKQCQSALHQQGGEAMLSELYGVTGWDYDFRGHKLQGDWQAALGVTVRVPHLTWMSMKGESKRDYPATIGYQSPWYDQYSMIETHFARLNTALTRGKPAVKVAVVHPIESYWLHWGPSAQTAAIRAQLEKNFSELTETLLFGLIDFDFLCEARLPELCKSASAPLTVGAMQYDVVIVPALHTMRSTTLALLEKFRDAGGKLIFLGDCPVYENAMLSTRPAALYARSECAAFSPASVLDALRDERIVDAFFEDGSRTDMLIHQLRKDGDGLWFFLCRGKNPVSPDVDDRPTLRVSIRGEYSAEVYETLTGDVSPFAVSYENGCTVFTRTWYMHDSLLLRLLPDKCSMISQASTLPLSSATQITKKVPILLDEPNMLLLDMAEYSLDGEPYNPEEELLRLDNACRVRIGIPPRMKHIVQPYLLKQETPQHHISLRFVISAEVDVSAPLLALEDVALTEIRFNGQSVASEPIGWYVDKAIQTVALPPVHAGENVLELTVPLATRTNLEYCYLLGDFGVRVDGRLKTIIAPVRELAFGSFTHQGLPFYTGNVTYQLDVETKEGALSVRTPQYRGALIGVEIDGQRVGSIAFSPYVFTASGLSAGRHTVGLKLYGTRQNGFAQLHHTQGVYFYQSADSWRSKGDLWIYEYQLKPFGILKSPEVWVE